MRRCGMLLPVASLPSRYGIGAFSKEAYEFVDQLKEAPAGLADSAPGVHLSRRFRRFSLPGLFRLCRESLPYQPGRPGGGGAADPPGV